ncbi:hypothetical protein [Endozoicomonas euniceicola]|uniref:Fido domain-containing protein n=1 Tax=Endozoicomonas euniceicola TaxID=1234143 RepID=A0ABY6GQV2_9GAMM|nr:hypothetical protein [Endozoicomonas euniceicola]UYM15130.1 hypothetical protein NX720_20025 [Endozoicomonas euniceicola]
MINSNRGSSCQSTMIRPKEPVEHSESDGEKCSVSSHSTEVRELSVAAIIPRSPVHKPSGMPGQATVQRASVSTTDGVKTPVESSSGKYSEKVIEKANDLFGHFHALIKKDPLNAYSTYGLFPYLSPESQGRIFCQSASKRLTCLLSDEALNSEEKDQILKFVVKRFNENHIYSEFQKEIINDFFESASVYLKQKAVFSHWEQKGAECTSTEPFYTSMHHLMVEGARRQGDVGWFSLNDEVGYLDRCCSAFMFLINKLIMQPDREINMALLNKAAGIIGSIVCFPGNCYPVSVNKNEDNTFFFDMLQKGRIYNKSNLSDSDFKCLLNDFFEDEMKKNGNKVFSIEDIQKNVPEYDEVLPYFKFIFKEKCTDENWLSFKLQYKSKNKQADCDELLENYYKSVTDKNKMLEIIEEVVTVCCEIQRRHPILDGNGRLFFFILPAVLLYQKGIWLKESLFNPWLLTDSKPPTYIAEKVVGLCIERPMFSGELDWKAGLSEADSARIFCTMGELEKFKEIINRKPELLNTKLRSSNMSLFCAAARNNRTEIVKFILDSYPDRTGLAELQNLLIDKESQGYDPELLQVLQDAVSRLE